MKLPLLSDKKKEVNMKIIHDYKKKDFISAE